MENCTEKIYCCGSDNNDLLAASILNNSRYGADNFMNNPFAYLMFLALLRNGGFGVDGGQGAQNVEMQNQLQAIRSQLQDNQNSSLIMDAIKGNGFALSQLSQNLNVDFNALKDCCCDVRAAIEKVAGNIGLSAEKVINAVNLGNSGLLAAIKDCCCSTQKELLRMSDEIKLQTCQQTNELRNGQRDLGQAITQGFSQVAFQAQQDKCDIIRAGQDNTQRIIDTLNTHWRDELSRENLNLKTKLSQREQTDAIIASMRYGNGCGTTYGNGCGCGL